ncbi:MAG: hypothetical protein NZM28_04010 [Fimbriimonadales bacterium]|nr:hypothetical protein [Fimbriimonadales bacterium]
MARGVKRRGWIWAGFVLGFTARILGAGALFWAVFPLWLSVFWSVQGYPPTLRDLPRWYALGAFNIAPIAGMVLASPLILGAVAWLGRRSVSDDSDLTPLSSFSARGEGGAIAAPAPRSPSTFTERRQGSVVRKIVLGSALYALLVPPIAYALLLIYAEMWQYRAWDMMTPTLLRAYLLLAPACGVVGGLLSWRLGSAKKTYNHYS